MLGLLKLVYRALFRASSEMTYRALRDGGIDGGRRYAKEIASGQLIIDVSDISLNIDVVVDEVSPPQLAAPTPPRLAPPKPTRTQLSRMKREQVLQVASDHGIKVDTSLTTLRIRQKILKELRL